MSEPAADPRSWEQIRDAVAGVLREHGAADPEEATDAVLGIFDEEAMNRLAQEYVKASRLRSFRVQDGAAVFGTVPAQQVLAAWILAARRQLDGTGAENYTETRVEFPDRPRGERYAFILQRVGKLTPHEARQHAEAEAERLREQVARMRARLAAAGRRTARARARAKFPAAGQGRGALPGARGAGPEI